MRTAIICDLDGTLISNWKKAQLLKDPLTRDPKFDWVTWNKENGIYDTLNPWCAALVKAMYCQGHRIIFMSARTDDQGVREMTHTWLNTNLPEILDYELILREKDDFQGDPTCKMGLYYRHVVNNYDVLFAIDDTEENCNMFRNLGLIALHCASY